MNPPTRIALGVALAVTSLVLAYAAGARFGVPEPVPHQAALVSSNDAGVAQSLDGVDYDRLLEGIAVMGARGSDVGPYRGAIDTLHGVVLSYMAQRLDLSAEERAAMQVAYAASADNMIIAYDQMMGSPGADTLATPSRPVIAYDTFNSVNRFVEVFAGNACSLLSFPGRAQLAMAADRIDYGGLEKMLNPRLTCRDVLGDAIGPIARQLREKAVIEDLQTSEMRIQSRVRSMVAELATAEERLSADFTDVYQTKVLFVKSEAALQARAEATVKVGFDLNKRFSVEMDHAARRMTIRLPEPEVLSNEVEVRFTDVQNGALVKIDRKKYNAALVNAREMLAEYVADSDVFLTAKYNARRIIETIFQPMVALPEFTYELDVRFPNGYNAPSQEPVELLQAEG